MKYVMCFMKYEKNDDACYSHSMTYLIRFGKSTDLSLHNIYHKERALLKHACPWCVLAYTNF